MGEDKEKKVLFSFQIEKNLKDDFIDTCKRLDTTAARELRSLIKKFIEKHKKA